MEPLKAIHSLMSLFTFIIIVKDLSWVHLRKLLMDYENLTSWGWDETGESPVVQ